MTEAFDTAATRRRLTFGAYPGGAAGTPDGLAGGAPDDPERIAAALDELQGEAAEFLVRGYVHYTSRHMASLEGETPHPRNVAAYAGPGRKVDLVVCFRDPEGPSPEWTAYVRDVVRSYGGALGKVQITEEPNLYHVANFGDAAMPGVREALVEGVVAAKDEVRVLGLDALVGFNAVPTLADDDEFWPSIGALANDAFRDALDYVGVDLFPDVFWRAAPDGERGDVRSGLEFLLTRFRSVNLPAAGVGEEIPIHVCENGWPTGPERPPERQAAVVEIVVRTVHGLADRLNVTHYEHFALRDADSSKPEIFHQFGLMRDDYTPKPAFETYRRLIAELGRRS
jgi:hypothetical protein